jgi:hypothetical protein
MRQNMAKNFLILLLMFWQPIGMAATTVKVSPDTIPSNDTFQLIIGSDSLQSGDIPNLAPLQQDFSILGTQRSLAYRMVNGQTTSHSEWIILLRPKRAGTITIPAIQVGQEKTKPTDIVVSEGDATTTMSAESRQDSAPKAIMLKTSVSESNPYVNQQVIYTVKLYSSQQLMNADYRPPSVENALLIPLGDGRHYQTQLNNQLYAVEEQQYAIFPQKSGSLTMQPPSFHAAVYEQFPRQLNVEAKPTTVVVRPAPSDAVSSHWLPAKNVTLTENYESPKKPLKEGDTLTRTVTLNVVAMPAQLLPTLTFEAKDGFSVYPDSPDVKNTIKQNNLVGTSTIKVTYLLNQAGHIHIPRLELPWFNTTTGKTEIASLPDYQVTVEPSSAASKKIGLTPMENASIKPIKVEENKAHQAQLATMLKYNGLWAFAAGLGVAAVLIALWWVYRRVAGQSSRHAKQLAIKRLREACLNNQPKHARDALLAWAHASWPEANILNLQDIAKLARDATLKRALTDLTQVLYQMNHRTAWQGKLLWQSFDAYRQSTPNYNQRRTDLPPINPTL